MNTHTLIDEIVKLIFDILLNPVHANPYEPTLIRWIPLLLAVLTIGSVFLCLHIQDVSNFIWLLPATLFLMMIVAIIHRLSKL